MPRHALDPATSIASKAATSATENTNSLMKAVLSKTTHGLSTSTAQSAVRMPGANPTDRNQLHAKTINGGKHYPADRHAPAQILWKSGIDFPDRGQHGAAEAADIWFERARPAGSPRLSAIDFAATK